MVSRQLAIECQERSIKVRAIMVCYLALCEASHKADKVPVDRTVLFGRLSAIAASGF